MKSYVQQEAIQPGQLTEIRGILMKARVMTPGVLCSSQCRCYDAFTKRCSGFCYRWDNYKDIVFVYADEPQGDYEVVETPFAANVRKITEQLMEQQKEEMPITSNEPQD